MTHHSSVQESAWQALNCLTTPEVVVLITVGAEPCSNAHHARDSGRCVHSVSKYPCCITESVYMYKNLA